MLTLSRTKGEAVVITVPGFPPIRVVFVGSDRGKLRIGFEADMAIKVMRAELLGAGRKPPGPAAPPV